MEPAADNPSPSVEPPTHIAQFYEDDATLVARATEQIGAALSRSDVAMVVLTPSHRAAVESTLANAGHDLEQARREGRYISLDATEILSRVTARGRLDEPGLDSVFGGSFRRLAGGSRPVMVFGELVALLAQQGDHTAAIDVERYWSRRTEEFPVTAYCCYPIAAFNRPEDGAALAHICDAHTAVEPVESFTSLTTTDDQARMIVMLQHKARALEREVAARAQAEQALRDQYHELQAALMAREEFLSVAAHELRTPMTGLRGNAQMLRRNFEAGREISPERMRRSLHAIEIQSLRLDHLITRLLDASQIEAGMLQVTPVATDLAALARSVIGQQPPRDSHELVFDGPDRLDAVVDTLRMGQVLANLLDNAIRYSSGGGRVVIRLTSDEERIEISVTDSGPGIPAEKRDAVFAGYRQDRTSRSFTGIGLGLFVSRQIVGLHGGSMRIEDPEHRGTRVVITLPADPAMATPDVHFDAD